MIKSNSWQPEDIGIVGDNILFFFAEDPPCDAVSEIARFLPASDGIETARALPLVPVLTTALDVPVFFGSVAKAGLTSFWGAVKGILLVDTALVGRGDCNPRCGQVVGSLSLPPSRAHYGAQECISGRTFFQLRVFVHAVRFPRNNCACWLVILC